MRSGFSDIRPTGPGLWMNGGKFTIAVRAREPLSGGPIGTATKPGRDIATRVPSYDDYARERAANTQ